MTKDEIEALIDSRIKLALAIDNNDDVRVAAFRKFLDVAINGGPGAFTDPAGKPLALIRDNALVEQVAALETQVAALDVGAIPPGTRFTAEVTK